MTITVEEASLLLNENEQRIRTLIRQGKLELTKEGLVNFKSATKRRIKVEKPRVWEVTILPDIELEQSAVEALELLGLTLTLKQRKIRKKQPEQLALTLEENRG